MSTPPSSSPHWATAGTSKEAAPEVLRSCPSDSHEKSLPEQTLCKKRIGRRFRYAVVLVPLMLIAIVASARILAHEDPFSALFTTSQLSIHRRQTSGSGTPTVPETPPVLPTPFVQPFDSGLPQNFSSETCSNFFTNMTTTKPFRACRSFALLLQTSNTFIGAQQNLTFLNDLVWGTCNTPNEESECVQNMVWFSESLRQECATDLKDGNQLASETLMALEAYVPMREVGCQVDPTTNTYCFVNAAKDSNPSNLYYYSLPLGISLPATVDPSCNACLKSLMGTFSSTIKAGGKYAGLLKTYENAAELTLGKCGVGFALTGLAQGSGAGASLSEFNWPRNLVVLCVSALVAVLAHVTA